jgi:uncharacterized protein YgbK (DUF1537 family)
MVKLLVIADDLTGALDTGVQFAKKGIPTWVRIEDAGKPPCGEEAGDVVVVDTESRHIPAEDAFARVRDAARWGKSLGASGLYKKTDSTLRGNIGAELAGLIAGAPSDLPLVFAPAFPALKRTTRGGFQYVENVSLEKTAFAQDRLNPITTASVARIIKTGPRGAELEVSSVKPGELDLRARGAGARVVVADSETEGDLAEVARRIRGFARERQGAPFPLLAGCAGFAAYLPELLDIGGFAVFQGKTADPLLAVNGSLNPVSLSQLRQALRLGAEGLRLVPGDLVSASAQEKLRNKIAGCLARGKAAALHNISDIRGIDAFNAAAAALGIPEKDLHAVLPQVYGKLVRSLAEDTAIGSLVVFGGDTLVGILRAFGTSSVIPLAEIATGVVLARIPGVDNPEYIITKAGGFGGEDLLAKLLRL